MHPGRSDGVRNVGTVASEELNLPRIDG